MKISKEKVWAGSEQTLQAALEAEEGVSARIAAGTIPTDPEEEQPYLLSIEDGLATVSIKGSLNNDSGIWNQIFGMTGYPDIRDALLAAANDASVNRILLDIDSGGGAVSGVEDTSKLIRMINDKVKPVTAYTDGAMASAAYWLGAAAGEVYSGKTALVGSIGVISTHMERSQMLADAGIGVTVVRSGKYKALANSVEKLTPEGKAQIQQIVDAANGVFVDAIAGLRGKSPEYVDGTMGQGREFVGQAAVDVGLIDGITSFDALMSDLKAKSIDASNNFMDNRGKPAMPMRGEAASELSGESDMKKKALTEQDIAAIAAGMPVVLAEVEAPNGDGVVVEPVVEAVVEPVIEAVIAPVVEAVVEGSVVSAQDDRITATVQLLNEQLQAKDAALLEAKVQIVQLTEKLAEAQATHEPLMAIATKSLDNMRVALNGTALGAGTMNAAQLVAEHASLAETFKSKFQAGGVTAVAGSAANDPKTQIDPRHKARVNAVRFSK